MKVIEMNREEFVRRYPDCNYDDLLEAERRIEAFYARSREPIYQISHGVEYYGEMWINISKEVYDKVDENERQTVYLGQPQVNQSELWGYHDGNTTAFPIEVLDKFKEVDRQCFKYPLFSAPTKET